jgi:cyclic-di-AMP phosphodiesterase PgpH
MKLFGTKRSRSAKAASLKAATSLTGRLAEQLSNSEVLLRLVLCASALVAIVLSVQAWQAPFPYRLGGYCPDGIVARTDFERVNIYRTDLARLEKEESVPLVFVHDVAPLRKMINSLREHLFFVAGIENLSQLPAEALAAFGFAQTTVGSNLNTVSPELVADFDALKKAVGPRETAEGAIGEILAEFEQLVKPLQQNGILDPAELTRHDLREGDVIQIHAPDKPKATNPVTAADVLLQEALKPNSGIIGREWKSFPRLAEIRAPLERWLANRAPITLQFDQSETRQSQLLAREGTSPVTDSFKLGAPLVLPGAYINEEALGLLRAQYDSIDKDVPWFEHIIRLATSVLLLLVLAIIIGYYLVHNENRLVHHAGRLAIYLTAIVLTIFLGQLLSFDPWRAEVIPVLCTVMVLAIAYNQVLAALTGFAISLVLTLSLGGGLGQFVVLMSATATAVVPLAQVESRSKLVKVGFWTAVIYLTVTWGIGILESQRLDRIWSDQVLLVNSLRGAGWCLAAGYLVAGSLPFIESGFGVVTDISLLELGDVSHPLLQELVRRAPGTYNHSIGVATIAETAADAIGANGLLCRVGAYFHDIGKMLKPQYFVENMPAGATSRHDSLAPAMSTLIIIGHVKDGVDLAKQHNLPDPLIDFVEQHHGTTLVEYFYRQATKQAGSQKDQRLEVEESSFRYPGPKPQSREAGVLMLADAVEGASRTLNEPTPKRIESLVHDLMLKRLLDGQFDESSLTLSELNVIADSLTKSLISIYHGRVKYPDQEKVEQRSA